MTNTRIPPGLSRTRRGRSTAHDSILESLVARFKRFAETPEAYILFEPRQQHEVAAPDEYVISAPTGYRAAAGSFRLALKDLHNHGGVDILDELHETGEKLACMGDEQLRQLRAMYPQLVIEPNLNYKLLRHPGFDDLSDPFFSSSGGTQQVTLTVQAANGTPISDAKVYVVLDSANRVGHVLQTDAAGTCTVRTKPSQIELISAIPRAGFWSGLLDHPAAAGTYAFTLDPLAPTMYGWGHTAANMRAGLPAGNGVRIGVIDTGVRSDHSDLAPAGGLNCIRGEDPSAWDDDEDGHGTHCAGIIAARGDGVRGYVPEATIRAYRVFPKGKDASTYTIAKALQAAIDDQCDVISMSFGNPKAQDTIRAKIEQAYDKGILCVAAAGNDRTSVYYPAAFGPTLAVAAFGEVGTYPMTSAHPRAETAATGRYVAEFSNFGPEIGVIAPGVAVVSTVPGGYAAWDGTSMAAPHVTGMAALTLARNPDLLGASRNGDRVDQLLKSLLAGATLLGVGTDREGSGFPQVP